MKYFIQISMVVVICLSAMGGAARITSQDQSEDKDGGAPAEQDAMKKTTRNEYLRSLTQNLTMMDRPLLCSANTIFPSSGSDPEVLKEAFEIMKKLGLTL
jgi:hypothetical protein